MPIQATYDFGELCITDNVLFVVCRARMFLDRQTAESILKARLAIQKNKKLPILFDMNGLTDSDKAGRDFFSLYSMTLCCSIVLYAKLDLPQTISRLLIKTVCNYIPCIVTDNSKDAIQFLNQHKL